MNDDENLVDVMAHVASSLGSIAAAITPANALPFHGPGGLQVGSLTEAIIYLAESLSSAIGDLAEAVREREA